MWSAKHEKDIRGSHLYRKVILKIWAYGLKVVWNKKGPFWWKGEKYNFYINSCLTSNRANFWSNFCWNLALLSANTHFFTPMSTIVQTYDKWAKKSKYRAIMLRQKMVAMCKIKLSMFGEFTDLGVQRKIVEYHRTDESYLTRLKY